MVSIVAEIGTAHNGDFARAARLVDMAARCGADVAKFQFVLADEIIHPNTGTVPLPGGDIPLYERFRRLEQPIEFYEAVKAHCDAVGIQFLCTPFGLESARSLLALGVTRVKVASPELNHVPLLEYLAGESVDLILSTGVSRLSDIEGALDIVGRSGVSLLHCVTAYPAPETDYNLRVIPLLSGIFGVPVGVSDHSLDPVLVPALSVAVGGMMIEKHITGSRDDAGLDDPIALDEGGLRKCVKAVRRAEGEGAAATIERLSADYGAEVVEQTLGTGVKSVADSEAQNYDRTNRSLHARVAIPAGHTLCGSDVQVLRTEKVLRPGLHPKFVSMVDGCVTTRAIPSGEGIQLEDLINRPATD